MFSIIGWDLTLHDLRQAAVWDWLISRDNSSYSALGNDWSVQITNDQEFYFCNMSDILVLFSNWRVLHDTMHKCINLNKACNLDIVLWVF